MFIFNCNVLFEITFNYKCVYKCININMYINTLNINVEFRFPKMLVSTFSCMLYLIYSHLIGINMQFVGQKHCIQYSYTSLSQGNACLVTSTVFQNN